MLAIARPTNLEEETKKVRCTVPYLSGVQGLAMVEWQL
jgi:hypothetical protein